MQSAKSAKHKRKVPVKGEETEGKLMMKSQRSSERDMLSDLPDCVLLHIMNFMDTKDAVQTCVLSKRWKDLWKHLTNLSFNSYYFRRLPNFSKFVSLVLYGRDDSISLHSLKFRRSGYIELRLLNRIMEYATLHNVQQLSIIAYLNINRKFEFRPFIFSCRSLKFLKLSINCNPTMIKLPKSLHLPALESLSLENVTFTAGDNDCAEPFSTCNMLNSLFLLSCCLHNDAQVLHISNSKLSSLTIDICYKGTYKISLSTPNLCSLTIVSRSNIQLSSTCDLSFLEEVSIDILYPPYPWTTGLLNLSWLPVLANAKIVTLSPRMVNTILNDLSNPGSMKIQPPCFVRLEALKVKMNKYAIKSEEEVTKIVEYLLQNSPTARVDVIIY